MDPVVFIELVQRKAVTALKLIAPLVEVVECEPDAASEATGRSSGESIEACPASAAVGLEAVWTTVDCAACAVAVAVVGSPAELEWLVTVAVESVAEFVAVADESPTAEVVVVACAWALERVAVSGAAAQIVAADVGQIALVGTAFHGAVEAELELEAVVVSAVAALVETDSADETLAVAVGEAAALDEGIARVLGEMADSRRRTAG